MVRGQYFYLCLIEGIYSRKAVGWENYRQESGELATGLLQRSVSANSAYPVRRYCIRTTVHR
ncbi:hypothetical protein D3C78_1554890 [compost metagenome]